MFKIKNLMLATATVAMLAIGGLASPSTAKADVCYGRGFGGGFGGPVYSRGFSSYRGGFAPYYGRSSFYRGGFGYSDFGYGRSAFYGPRSRGFNLSIGF